jgi:deoxyribose-phosphate aldolase
LENLNEKIEFTNLNPDLNWEDIEKLIRKSLDFNFFGICIPPFWIKKAKRELSSTPLALITVVGFPLGYQRTEAKSKEIELALEDGADEIDMVWNISAFKTGMNWPKIEIAKCAKFCHEGSALLKVIIETSLLSGPEIELASMICSDSGADFIKTSTGFLGSGNPLRDVELIRKSIPKGMRIKASGGIDNLAIARALVQAGADRLGTSSADQWI